MKIKLGKHNNIPESSFNSQQFKIGMKVEREHTDDLEKIKAIVKDHLAEDPNYYTKLKKMETSMTNEIIIPNPLYVKHQSKVQASTRPVETSSFSNTQEGICPKCQTPMGKANLGLAMGHQEVHYCERCRVAEPIAN